MMWRYDIQYGPEGEANYAWVYNAQNEMVCTTETHHAKDIVDAANAALSSGVRVKLADMMQGGTISVSGGDITIAFATSDEAGEAFDALLNLSAIETTQAPQKGREMTGFLDTLTEDQLKAAMEYRGEDDHPAQAPDELKRWSPVGYGGMMIDPEGQWVTFADAQAAIAAAEEAENEAKDSFWAIYPEWIELKGHGISTEAARTMLVERAEAAEARVAELEKALEPFARHLDEMKFDLDHEGNKLPDDQPVGWVYVTNGDFRRARSALHPEREG